MSDLIESDEATCELRITIKTDPPKVFSKQIPCMDKSIEVLGMELLEQLLKEMA